MNEEKVYYCEHIICNNEIAKPEYCCNSFDCGCQGRPISPPICGNQCYDRTISDMNIKDKGTKLKALKRKKTDDEKIIVAQSLNIQRLIDRKGTLEFQRTKNQYLDLEIHINKM